MDDFGKFRYCCAFCDFFTSVRDFLSDIPRLVSCINCTGICMVKVNFI